MSFSIALKNSLLLTGVPAKFEIPTLQVLSSRMVVVATLIPSSSNIDTLFLLYNPLPLIFI